MTAHGIESNLVEEVFLLLRQAFFQLDGSPVVYTLRDKANTQDDPFDELVHGLLSERLAPGTVCRKAPGPLITPDLVVLRKALCDGVSREVLTRDLSLVFAVEVKKLERGRGGSVARASGADFNTTPPCGLVRVYDRRGGPLDIRGFYLFVCQEPVPEVPGSYCLTALALCDGNLLNEDFELYRSIIGERTKQIGLGTYRDGANRVRPMMIFGNPLGITRLDREVTLVLSDADPLLHVPRLRRVGTIRRTIPRLPSEHDPDVDAPAVVQEESVRAFGCYRVADDVPAEFVDFDLRDPFPTPARDERTQPRGRFHLDVLPGV